MMEGIMAAYHGALNVVFAPIVGLPPVIGEMLIASLIFFVITLFYKYMIDQNAIREIKSGIKKYQEEIKKAQKENPEKIKELMSEMMKLTNKQMRMTFKPMIPTLIFVLLFLPWMATVFVGPLILVPFYWPLSETNAFGWLMWYIILSIPMTQIFRKIMGVEL